jgi:cobalt-zinc-cadmium efflux system protein
MGHSVAGRGQGGPGAALHPRSRSSRWPAALEHVTEVHDLHIWEVTSGYAALSAHILVTPGADCHAVRIAVERLMHDEYGIGHTTLQVDHATPELLALGGAEAHCADPHGPVHRRDASPMQEANGPR